MTALIYVAGIFTGAFVGVLFMGMVSAGKREDTCRTCRRDALDQAFRECDGVSYGGTDD